MQVIHAGVAALTVAVAAGLAGPTALANRSGENATLRATTVAVSPSPGDRFATPQTTISFRGVTPAALGTVRVTGSHSGVHAGRLVADPAGYTIWKPQAAFVPGERVTVHTAVVLAGAGGDSFSFTVARVAPKATASSSATPSGSPRAGSTCTPHLPSFHSAPGLTPPGACVNLAATGTAPGYLFVTPLGTHKRGNGAAIFSNRGNLIWYDPVDTLVVNNLEPVTYDSRPMLAFFRGGRPRHGHPEYVLMNEHYRVVAYIRAGNGDQVDAHELTITPRNTALIGCYVPVRMNLTAYGGTADQIVWNYVVQEINVRTGNVLFSWDSLDHVPITDSDYPVPSSGTPYDYFHGNSISLTSDGNLLISGRRVSAVYKVNRATGAVMWELGGKNSSFTLAPPGQQWFCYQHDARQPQPNVITLFDDGGAGPSTCPNHASRGLTLTLSTATHTATITSDLSHNPQLYAALWGSDQTLPNGDDLVSWGRLREITEFSAASLPNFDMSFSGGTYRAIRTPWTGVPGYPPAAAATKGLGNAVTVYMSWNGDTQVASWQILAGNSPSSLQPVGLPQRKTGFETKITVHTAAPLVAAQARNPSGKILATSPAISPS